MELTITKPIDKMGRLALPELIRTALFGPGDQPGIGLHVRMDVQDGKLIVVPTDIEMRCPECGSHL